MVVSDLVRGLAAALVLACVAVTLGGDLDPSAFMAALVLSAPLAWWIGGLAERAAYALLSRLS